jgi:hypothetical protein
MIKRVDVFLTLPCDIYMPGESSPGFFLAKAKRNRR